MVQSTDSGAMKHLGALDSDADAPAGRRVEVTSALVPDCGFSDFNSVLRDTCNRFTRVTGWLLTFQRAEGELAEALESRLRLDDEVFWYSRVNSGYSTVGILSIVRQPNVPPNKSEKTRVSRLKRIVFPLADACDAAEIIANLLNQIATRSQILEISGRPELTAEQTDHNTQHRLDVLRFLSGYDGVAIFVQKSGTLKLTLTSGIESELVPKHTRVLDEDSIDSIAMHGTQPLVAGSKLDLVPRGFAQAICLPLDRRNRELGTLWFYSRDQHNTDRIENTCTLAGRFAGTFEDMAAVRVAEDNSELRQDLRLLRRIQNAASLEDPLDSSLEMGHASISKSEVNGDLCEQLAIDEHRTFIAIGDACGHGLPAAVINSAVRCCLRCLTSEAPGPPPTSELLRIVGNAISTTTPTYMFMTLFVGIVDSRENKLFYSNAGHPAPLLNRAGSGLQQVPDNGLLLGIMEDADYEDREIGFAPGDTLIAFTDGIAEARNKSGELFNHAGVEIAVETAPNGASAQDIVDHVMEQARNFSHEAFPDDVTILVAKRS